MLPLEGITMLLTDDTVEEIVVELFNSQTPPPAAAPIVAVVVASKLAMFCSCKLSFTTVEPLTCKAIFVSFHY